MRRSPSPVRMNEPPCGPSAVVKQGLSRGSISSMRANTRFAPSNGQVTITGRTTGVIFSHAWLSASCMARASNPSTGVNPFFSDRPRMIQPPEPLENADSVSVMVEEILRLHSLTSHCCVSLPIMRISSISSVIFAV